MNTAPTRVTNPPAAKMLREAPHLSRQTHAMNPQQLLEIFSNRRTWLIIGVPVAICAFLSLAYAVVSPKKYEARQVLSVRDSYIGQEFRFGRFESLDTMKTALETIQDFAKNRAVIKRVLASVGPDNGRPSKAWPTDDAIDAFQQSISFVAPGGTEFGKTDVVHLLVRAKSPERAKKLTTALCTELDLQLKKNRLKLAESLEKEMAAASQMTQIRLDDVSGRVGQLETSVGADLGELRSLNDPASGEGQLRRSLSEIRTELRQASQKEEQVSQQIVLLKSATHDQNHLLAMPNELLTAQPSLKVLKQGVLAAKISQAQLAGKYSPVHPAFKSSGITINTLREHVEHELDASLSGLEKQQSIYRQNKEWLANEEQKLVGKLQHLAELRVNYGLLVDEQNETTKKLNEIRSALGSAQSMKKAAQSVSMFVRLEEPQVSNRPVGMSRRAIVLCGTFAGLLIGVGMLMLLTPVPTAGHGHASSTEARWESPTVQHPAAAAADHESAHAYAAEAGHESSTVSTQRTRELLEQLKTPTSAQQNLASSDALRDELNIAQNASSESVETYGKFDTDPAEMAEDPHSAGDLDSAAWAPVFEPENQAASHAEQEYSPEPSQSLIDDTLSGQTDPWHGENVDEPYAEQPPASQSATFTPSPESTLQHDDAVEGIVIEEPHDESASELAHDLVDDVDDFDADDFVSLDTFLKSKADVVESEDDRLADGQSPETDGADHLPTGDVHDLEIEQHPEDQAPDWSSDDEWKS